MQVFHLHARRQRAQFNAALAAMGMGGPRGGAPEVVVSAIVYLRRKHGMRTDTIQTLREYLIAGRPAPWRYGNKQTHPRPVW